MSITFELVDLAYAPWGLFDIVETPFGERQRPKIWLTEQVPRRTIEEGDIELTENDLEAIRKSVANKFLVVEGIDLDVEPISQPPFIYDVNEERKKDKIAKDRFDNAMTNSYPYVKELISKNIKEFKKDFKQIMDSGVSLNFLRALVKEEEKRNKPRITILNLLDKAIKDLTYSITQDSKFKDGRSYLSDAYYELIEVIEEDEDEEE